MKIFRAIFRIAWFKSPSVVLVPKSTEAQRRPTGSAAVPKEKNRRDQTPECASPPPSRPASDTRRNYPNRKERAVLAQNVADTARRKQGHRIKGKCYVIDGDTIVIKHVHIRLAGIDAPELDHPWGQKSKWEMVKLCKDQEITAHVTGELSYNRVVATCHLPDGRDLAAELVKQGLALDWHLFSGGKYRCHEPPDARKRLWRAAGRQGRGGNAARPNV